MKLKRASSFNSRTPHTVGLHTQKLNMWQVGNVLIEAGSLIQAGSPIQAGGSKSFVVIEAGGLY